MQDVQKNVLYAAHGFLRVAFRARQRYTGACRPKMLRFTSWHSNTHRKQTRCAKLPSQKKGRVGRNPFRFQEK